VLLSDAKAKEIGLNSLPFLHAAADVMRLDPQRLYRTAWASRERKGLKSRLLSASRCFRVIGAMIDQRVMLV
jgi:hypothetical protein